MRSAAGLALALSALAVVSGLRGGHAPLPPARTCGRGAPALDDRQAIRLRGGSAPPPQNPSGGPPADWNSPPGAAPRPSVAAPTAGGYAAPAAANRPLAGAAYAAPPGAAPRPAAAAPAAPMSQAPQGAPQAAPRYNPPPQAAPKFSAPAGQAPPAQAPRFAPPPGQAPPPGGAGGPPPSAGGAAWDSSSSGASLAGWFGLFRLSLKAWYVFTKTMILKTPMLLFNAVVGTPKMLFALVRDNLMSWVWGGAWVAGGIATGVGIYVPMSFLETGEIDFNTREGGDGIPGMAEGADFLFYPDKYDEEKKAAIEEERMRKAHDKEVKRLQKEQKAAAKRAAKAK